jgi:hypothetical protein
MTLSSLRTLLQTGTTISEVYFDWKRFLNKPDKSYPCVLWSLDGASFTRDVRSSSIQELKIITCTVFAIAYFDFVNNDKIQAWDVLEVQFETYLNTINDNSQLQIMNIDEMKGEYIGEGMISAGKEIGIMYKDVTLKMFC